jgi:hypothetical protein
MYICVCIYIYIYIYIHTHTHLSERGTVVLTAQVAKNALYSSIRTGGYCSSPHCAVK